MAGTWIDRVATTVSPRWALKRERARLALGVLQRHYEGAAASRRTQGWNRSTTDANGAIGPSLARLRESARDLVRNNPFAASAVSTIVDQAVGWGIVATQVHPAWKAWAESTAIDADGRNNLAGLEKLVMATVVESGEVLVRRRVRRLEDGLPIPLQLQVLEPDFLDTLKDGTLPNGGRIIQGIEFDALGKRAAYWLFASHPGSTSLSGTRFGGSHRVPAEDILHIFKQGRPGQVRAASWFAPVLLRFKDFDEYEDAQLMKQKIAACLAVITSDVDGTGPALGSADTTTSPEIDSLEPGMILNVAPGRTIEVVQPPRVGEYGVFSEITLRSIATGLGVTYEDLTGDYTDLPYSAARMSRLRQWARVDDWRWRLLVPQFLDPVWTWAMEASAILGLEVVPTTEWTAPPLPMIEPDKEGLAMQRNIRTGIQTLSEAIRERGYVPETFLQEMSADYKRLDELGLVLDSDPRKMTQAGQLQGAAAAAGDDAGTRIARLFSSVSEERAAEWLTAMFDERRAPAPPITVNVSPSPVTVNAPITNHNPETRVQVEAPISVAAAPAPDVRITAPITVAVPDSPRVRAVTKTVLRDEDGRMTGTNETTEYQE